VSLNKPLSMMSFDIVASLVLSDSRKHLSDKEGLLCYLFLFLCSFVAQQKSCVAPQLKFVMNVINACLGLLVGTRWISYGTGGCVCRRVFRL